MPDLSLLKYLLVPGIGALVGLIGVPIMALAAWAFPILWPWLFAPVAVGAVGGLLAASWMD